MKRVKQILKDNAGSGISQYVATALVGILFMGFLAMLLPTISLYNAVQDVNATAKLISKNIQLIGAVDRNSVELLKDSLAQSNVEAYTATVEFEKDGINKTVTFQADTANVSEAVRLGTKYTVLVTGTAPFLWSDKTITGKSVGISEVYQK